MNLKTKYLWVTQRSSDRFYWTKFENGDEVGHYFLSGYPHTQPFWSAEDIFIYQNNIYVADNYNGIFVINDDLTYKTGWNPLQTSAIFVYKDEVYVGHQATNTVGAIQVYSIAGTLKRQWAYYGPAPAFYNCRGMYVLKDKIYASMDKYEEPAGANSWIYIYDLNGNEIAKLDVPNGSGRPLAWGLWIYNNELYMADYNQCLIRVFDLNLQFKRQFGPGYHIGSSSPLGVMASGKKVVANITYPENNLVKFTDQGVSDPTFTSDIAHPGGLFMPTGYIDYLPIMGIG